MTIVAIATGIGGMIWLDRDSTREGKTAEITAPMETAKLDPYQTQRTIWSRGFASIYGEWETTGEAKRARRTYAESQRFPEPKMPVQLILKKRAPDGTFREISSQLIDPTSRFVDRSAPARRGEAGVVFESGPPATKVDLLLLSDGYTAAEKAKFESDARRWCWIRGWILSSQDEDLELMED